MYPGFDPDETDNEKAQTEDALQEKKGWFHGWTQISVEDVNSGNYLIQLNGIIEKEDGQLEMFPYEYFRFISAPV